MTGAQAMLVIKKTGKDTEGFWSSIVVLYVDPDRGITPEDKIFAMPGNGAEVAEAVTYHTFINAVSASDQPYLLRCVNSAFEEATRVRRKKMLTGIRYIGAKFLRNLLSRIESVPA